MKSLKLHAKLCSVDECVCVCEGEDAHGFLWILKNPERLRDTE